MIRKRRKTILEPPVPLSAWAQPGASRTVLGCERRQVCVFPVSRAVRPPPSLDSPYLCLQNQLSAAKQDGWHFSSYKTGNFCSETEKMNHGAINVWS